MIYHLWRYHDHNPNYDQHNLSFFSWCSPVLILFMSFCTLWQRIRWKYLQIYKQIWQRTRWNYFQIFTNTCRSAQGENIFKYLQIFTNTCGSAQGENIFKYSQIFTNTFGSAQGGKKLQFYKIYTNMAAHKVKIFSNIWNMYKYGSAQGENILKYLQIFTNTYGSAQGENIYNYIEYIQIWQRTRWKYFHIYKIYTNMAAHKVKIFTNIQNLSSLFWNLIDIHYQNVQMSKVPFF